MAIEEDLSLVEIQQLLVQASLGNEALVETHPEMTARLNVAAAFDLSWKELDENAQVLGYLLSLFASAPIPWSLVESVLTSPPTPLLQGEGGTLNCSWDAWHKADKLLPNFLARTEEQDSYSRHSYSPLPSQGRGAGGVRSKLAKSTSGFVLKFNLIKRTEKDTYQLHQLIREFFQDKREESAEAEELKRGFCQVMVAVAKDIPQEATLFEYCSTETGYPSPSRSCNYSNRLVECDEDFYWPFVGLGRFYTGQGYYNEALPWREQCLSSTKARLGENHPNVATSLNNLAELYRSQGRYTEAEPLYVQALEIAERRLGINIPILLPSVRICKFCVIITFPKTQSP